MESGSSCDCLAHGFGACDDVEHHGESIVEQSHSDQEAEGQVDEWGRGRHKGILAVTRPGVLKSALCPRGTDPLSHKLLRDVKFKS